MYKYLFISLFFLSCGSSNIEPKPPLTFVDTLKMDFKDRALCNCIVMGLDSAGTNAQLQKLKFNDMELKFLFDSTIDENLKEVMNNIYLDSLDKIHTVSVDGQGKEVMKFCLKYYKSKSLDSLVNEVSKSWGKYRSYKDVFFDVMPYPYP